MTTDRHDTHPMSPRYRHRLHLLVPATCQCKNNTIHASRLFDFATYHAHDGRHNLEIVHNHEKDRDRVPRRSTWQAKRPSSRAHPAAQVDESSVTTLPSLATFRFFSGYSTLLYTTENNENRKIHRRMNCACAPTGIHRDLWRRFSRSEYKECCFRLSESLVFCRRYSSYGIPCPPFVSFRAWVVNLVWNPS